MNSPYGHCSLYLCPRPSGYLVDDISSFVNALQDIGFLAQQITTNQNSYYTGIKFLDYIAYMGCSPAIQFEPGADNNKFCHITLHHFSSAHLIYSKAQAKPPVCPHCKKSLESWPDNKASTVNCKHCNTVLPLEKLNWRKMAGFARLFIEITDIFPKEAIPQQSFLDKLATITDTEWQYFYSCR